MQDFTKEDFLEWQKNKVSRAVLLSFQDMIELGKEELSQSAGVDPVSDSRKVGKIDGLRTFTNITYYELQGEDN